MKPVENRPLYVGMYGLGSVAGGVSDKFQEKLAEHNLVLKTIVVNNPSKDRGNIQIPAKISDDPHDIQADSQIDIVVELTGAENHIARQFITGALRQGKHVVTAHKQVLGEYLPELHDLARTSEVSLSYEASVCGAIPVVRTFEEYWEVQKVLRLAGIINGTTNYILGRMGEGMDFTPALKEAQVLGVAESDPTNDIEGLDARAKLSVLATLASGIHIKPKSIPCQGITKITLEDIAAAKEDGRIIKLIASAQQEAGVWNTQVHPEPISLDNPLASVTGTYNSITIEGDLSGAITLHGRGAGRYPTTAAVLADILHAARHIRYKTPDFLPKLQRAAETASVH